MKEQHRCFGELLYMQKKVHITPWVNIWNGTDTCLEGFIMTIKLIATDLDGTFLDDRKQFLDANMKAFAECAERGIHIVPATGRTIVGVPEEIRNLPGVRYVITSNGASVVDVKTGEVISACTMSTETVVKIMELARDSQDDIMYDAYVGGIGYTKQEFWDNLLHYVPNPAILDLVRKTRKPVPDNIEYIKESGASPDKINLFFVEEEARVRMRKVLAEIPEILVTSSLPNNLEINAVGADKGGALLRLAELLGIRREETMAFGDGENDMSMLRMAGIGVAMENAEDHVKAAADYVTVTNNEAGVAAAIRKFVL